MPELPSKSTIICAECAVACNVPENLAHPSEEERHSDNWLSYCVDCKQVLCRRCIGRTHHPELTKKIIHVFEEIDWKHTGKTQYVAMFFINSIVLFWVCVGLYFSNISQSYFRGENICPIVGSGRRWLIWFDGNAFHWFKANISVTCDLEDSFWRLFMDGWMRGVVTGTDSWILLLTSCQKAMLFKVAAAHMLVPICALFYAALASVAMGLVQQVDGVVSQCAAAVSPHHAEHDFSIAKHARNAIGGLVQIKSQGEFSKFKKKISLKVTAWNNWFFGIAEHLCTALCISGALRLMVRFFLMRYAQTFLSLVAPHVNNWQLLVEPFFFWQMGHFMIRLKKVIPGMLPVTGVIDPTIAAASKAFKGKLVPVTAQADGISDCMHKDWPTYIMYTKLFYLRQFDYYKAVANNIIVLIFDDIFNSIVVLRFLGVPFVVNRLVTLWAYCLSCIGITSLQSILESHHDWFHAQTGIRQGDNYPSDTLIWKMVGLGAYEVKSFSWLGFETLIDETFTVAVFWSAIWRVGVPYLLYRASNRWTIINLNKKKEFLDRWQGLEKDASGNWNDDAGYFRLHSHIGSFWKKADMQEIGARKWKKVGLLPAEKLLMAK